MASQITQRELRNNSGEILRQLDLGASFVVTRNGIPVGELSPLRRYRFIRAEAAVAAFTRNVDDFRRLEHLLTIVGV